MNSHIAISCRLLYLHIICLEREIMFTNIVQVYMSPGESVSLRDILFQVIKASTLFHPWGILT